MIGFKLVAAKTKIQTANIIKVKGQSDEKLFLVWANILLVISS